MAYGYRRYNGIVIIIGIIIWLLFLFVKWIVDNLLWAIIILMFVAIFILVLILFNRVIRRKEEVIEEAIQKRELERIRKLGKVKILETKVLPVKEEKEITPIEFKIEEPIKRIVYKPTKRIYRGTYIDDKGYKRFWDNNRLVHRDVAYKQLWVWDRYNQPFRKYEVHHIDGNKLNNSYKNLKIVTKAEHRKIHGG